MFNWLERTAWPKVECWAQVIGGLALLGWSLVVLCHIVMVIFGLGRYQ